MSDEAILSDDNDIPRKRICKGLDKNTLIDFEQITKIITLMTAVDTLPFTFVENKGFRMLLNYLCPEYIVPSKSAIARRMELLYNQGKDILTSKLESAGSVSVTTDAWSSQATKSYTTMTFHFINPNWEFEVYNLKTIELEKRHTAKNLQKAMDKSLADWKIEEKVTGVVHDNAGNITLAVKNSEFAEESVSCSVHTLQLAVNTGLKKPTVKSLISKASKTVGHFKHSYLVTQALKDQQKLLNLPNHKLIQSCATRFNSVYGLCSRLNEQKEAVIGVSEDDSVAGSFEMKLGRHD